jgi:hypothetical protein
MHVFAGNLQNMAEDDQGNMYRGNPWGPVEVVPFPDQDAAAVNCADAVLAVLMPDISLDFFVIYPAKRMKPVSSVRSPGQSG